VDETYQFGMVTGLVKNYYEDGKLHKRPFLPRAAAGSIAWRR